MSFAIAGMIKATKEVILGIVKEIASLIKDCCVTWEEIIVELKPHRHILNPILKPLAGIIIASYIVYLYYLFG